MNFLSENGNFYGIIYTVMQATIEKGEVIAFFELESDAALFIREQQLTPNPIEYHIVRGALHLGGRILRPGITSTL